MLKKNKLGLAIAYLSALGAAEVSSQVAANEKLVLEEIVVTARMREESLQSTPLSITALSGDLLKNRNITDVRSLMDQTPGVYFTNQGGPGLGNVSLRGLTQGSLIGDEANVASFVDGFYWSGRIAFDGFLDGLERVEVVRGPQSALYGRNSFSGAINYITKKPDMEEMHGGVKATYGSDGRREYSGNFTTPIIENELAIRVDASHLETGSTIENSVNNERLNDAESDNLRLQLSYSPIDRLSIQYAFTYVDRDTTDQPLYGVPQNELDGGLKQDFISFSYRNHKIRNPEARPDSDLDRHVSNFIESTYEVERHTLRLDYDFNTFTSSLLLAQTDEDIRSIQDATFGLGGNVILANLIDVTNPTAPPNIQPVDLNGDFIPDFFPVVGGQPIQDREDFSIELRFQSNTEGPLSWEVGAFYSKLEYTDVLETGYDISEDTMAAAQAWGNAFPVINGGIIPATYDCNPFAAPTADCVAGFPQVIDTWGVDGGIQVLQEKFFENEDKSVFAVIGYELTEQTSVQVELRQTWEERTLDDRIERTGLYDNPFPTKISEDYNTFTPRVTVDHQLNEETFLYATAGKGSKAGGVQPSQSAGSTFYEPEENWTYEVGAKLILLDGRMNLNLAAFYVDWTDMQLRENTGLDTVVTNIGEAEVTGLEILGAYKVHPAVQMRFGYTYQDGEIKEGSTRSAAGFCDMPQLEHERVNIGFGDPAAFNPVVQAQCGYEAGFWTDESGGAGPGSLSLTTGNIQGNRMANAPETNVVYGVDVDIPVSDGMAFFATADINYRSQTYLDFENFTEIDSTTLVNAQFGIQGENWRVAVWGENLTDEDTVIAAIRSFNILGQASAGVQHRNGTMYGLTLSAEF